MSKLYDQYYTSADCTTYLVYNHPVTGRKEVFLDLAIGIGFRHSMSVIPIYGLGMTDPAFFSRGNSIVSGQLDVAFKDHKYLSVVMNHLLDLSRIDKRREELTSIVSEPNTQAFKNLKEADWALLSSTKTRQNTNNSITSFLELVDIVIKFDNTSALVTNANIKEITLTDVRFTEEVIGVTNADMVVMDSYKFLAKNVK